MRVRFGVLAVAFVAGLVGPPSAAYAKPTPDPLAKASATVGPAVVYVEVHWQGRFRDVASGNLYDDGQFDLVQRCSGFAVSSDGYLVTAGHCVDPKDTKAVFVPALVER